jgi:hypothetical protein
MYAELVLLHPGKHQFFYFAEQYLPRGISRIVALLVLVEFVFILTIYLILAPAFAALIFGMKGVTAAIILWALGSVFMFAKLSFQGIAELIGIGCILIIVGVVLAVGGTATLQVPAVGRLTLANFFLPFGPLFFSLAGRPAIHGVVAEHRRAGKKNFSLTRAIFWGTLLPAVIYGIFVISVLRLNPNVSPEALNSLQFLHTGISFLLGFMGLIALWTSYFVIGANVRDILAFDFRLPPRLAYAFAAFGPLVLYALGSKNFLGTLSFVGSVFLGLDGIFVVFMWQRAFPTNRFRWICTPLYCVFGAALFYELFTFL